MQFNSFLIFILIFWLYYANI